MHPCRGCGAMLQPLQLCGYCAVIGHACLFEPFVTNDGEVLWMCWCGRVGTLI